MCYNIATLLHKNFLFTCKTLCLMYSKWLGGMKKSLTFFCFTFQQTIVCKEGRLFCILSTEALFTQLFFFAKMCQNTSKIVSWSLIKEGSSLHFCYDTKDYQMKVYADLINRLRYFTSYPSIA